MANSSGLGRGLNALIPSRKPTANHAVIMPAVDQVHQLPINSVQPNPHQPRLSFAEVELQDLANSIKEHGVLQPIVVYPEGDHYYLIAGERRLRASKLAGMPTIPAIVRPVAEQQRLELALIENIQRVNLNPIEEALAYRRLMDEFNITQEVVAKKLGKNRSTVANSLRLLTLPANIQEAVAGGVITEGHARALVGLDATQQQAYFQKIIDQKLSVRDTERTVKEVAVRSYKRQKSVNPAVQNLVERWQEHLGTKVEIKPSGDGGTVVIHYYSADELDHLTKQVT